MRSAFTLGLVLTLCASSTSAQQAASVLSIGAQAPPLSVEDWLQAPANPPTDWDALRGRAVVLDFWATWCGGCVESIPHLNQLVERFKDKPVVFLSITDEDQFIVGKFLRLKPLKGWIGLDTDTTTFEAYGVPGRPFTVLVGPDGNVAAITQMHNVTDQAIEDLLAGRVPSVEPLPLSLAAALVGETDVESTVKPPLFQVSIRPASPGPMMNIDPEAGRLAGRGVTFRKALAYAYRVSQARVEVPAALAETAYDIEVTTPKGRSDLLHPLLQQALEQTFAFTVRQEEQERDVYVLSTTPTLSLRPADPSGTVANTYLVGQFVGRRLSLSSLVAFLENTLLIPVVDETGLQGLYDFEVLWDEETPDSFLPAVREQMGLDLQPAKRAVHVLVVESVQVRPGN